MENTIIVLIFQSLYLFTIAIVLALLEIQIEGQYPWAEKLPTWRKKIKGINKDITGYHIFLAIFVLLLFHLPYIFGRNFTISNELKLLSVIVLISVNEDFLWYILNPNPKFGIRNFKRNYVPLFNKFFFYIPSDYSFSIILSLLLALVANEILWWTITFMVFLILTVLLTTIRYLIDLKNERSTNQPVDFP